MMPTDLLVISCGGLGVSQLGELEQAIRDGVPNALVETPGGNDQFHSDLWANLRDNEAFTTRGRDVILIGHSLGVDAVVDCLWDLDAAGFSDTVVRAVYLLEAVWRIKRLPSWATATKEPPLVTALYGDFPFDFPQADVEGVPRTVIKGTSHNSLPHDPNVIRQIVSRLRFIAEAA